MSEEARETSRRSKRLRPGVQDAEDEDIVTLGTEGPDGSCRFPHVLLPIAPEQFDPWLHSLVKAVRDLGN